MARYVLLAGCTLGVPACAGAAGPQTPLAVLPFTFFDTSGELRDQNAEHTQRLAAMAGELKAGLESSGLYRIVGETTPIESCGRSDTECILRKAQDMGVVLVLTGAVQKVSTMASDVWIGAFDAATGKRVFYRQLTFRGDTDDAWHHATAFLVHQIEADPPKVP